jgi:inhibitor of cysteine peptidase
MRATSHWVLALLLLLAGGGPARTQAAEKALPTGAPAQRILEVSQSDDGKTLKPQAGQPIVIRLAGNPSTGYSWRVAAISGSAVQTAGEPAYERGENRPGAAGAFVFRLSAVKVGKSELKLEYVRPWEKNQRPAKTFSVTFEVSGGGETKTKELTLADNGKTFRVTVGETIAISLEGNPTTGFGWRTAKIEGQAVEAAGEPQYVPQPHRPAMVGTGGTFVCKFKAVKPGKATAELEYVRPWEKDIPPATTFTATFEVQAP